MCLICEKRIEDKKEGQMHLRVDGSALRMVLQLKFNEASPSGSAGAVRCYCGDTRLLSLSLLCPKHRIAHFLPPTGVRFQNKAREKYYFYNDVSTRLISGDAAFWDLALVTRGKIPKPTSP